MTHLFWKHIFNISSALELLQNIEVIFTWFYIGSDVIDRIKYSITHSCVTRREKLNYRNKTEHVVSFSQ